MEYFELSARYDSRKSFYGKAHVMVNGNIEKLYSYTTHVATYNKLTKKLKIVYVSSVTTNRHIREFARQHGIEVKKVELGEYC